MGKTTQRPTGQQANGRGQQANGLSKSAIGGPAVKKAKSPNRHRAQRANGQRTKRTRR